MLLQLRDALADSLQLIYQFVSFLIHLLKLLLVILYLLLLCVLNFCELLLHL